MKTTTKIAASTAAALLVPSLAFGYSSVQAAPTGPTPALSQALHQGHHNQGTNSPAAPVSPTAATDSSSFATRPMTPEAALKQLGERIKAKDIDGIIALHEKEAAIVDWDGSVVRGHVAIRKFYIEWFKSDPVLTVNPKQTTIAGGERIFGKVYLRTAAVMGDYSLTQNAADGTRETFTGDFCDTLEEQPDGSWLYVLDNPYPPHGGH